MVKTVFNAPILQYNIEMEGNWQGRITDILDANIYTEEMAVRIFNKKIARNKEHDNKYYSFLALRAIDKNYRWYTIEQLTF